MFLYFFSVTENHPNIICAQNIELAYSLQIGVNKSNADVPKI